VGGAALKGRHFRWFQRIWLIPFACGWGVRRIERQKRLDDHMPPPMRARRVMARDEKTVEKKPGPECPGGENEHLQDFSN
jgi:hypothetical protein